MSKINTVRLQDAAQNGYDPRQINQLVRSLEQIVLQLNSTYTSAASDDKAGAMLSFMTAAGSGGFSGHVQGFQTSTGITLPYAMLMSDVDQANAGTTQENLLTYNQFPYTAGIRVENNSRIYVPATGQYLVTFSLQVTNRSNTAAVFEVWAKDTGQNYPLSLTRFDIPARKSSTEWSHIVPAVSGIFTVNDPSQNYLEIAWWSDNPDVFVQYYPENTSPTRPAVPSVILTINYISAQ